MSIAHLKPIGIEDYEIINDYLQKYPSENCDFNICTLFSWGQYFKVEYTIFKDRLILFNPYYRYLLFPIGEKFSASELYNINNCCEEIHQKVEIMVVSESYINETNDITDYFSIINDTDWNDYIYSTESLVNLQGKKLAKKKNLISQFKKQYQNWEIMPIENNDINELIDFANYWKNKHFDSSNSEDEEYLAIEMESLKISLQHWDLLPNEGIKLYVDGKICAFAIFSPQTHNMATIHFEKYDPLIKGAAQLINHETAKLLLNRFSLINREQDIGLTGIRQAKKSYQPLRMLPFYRLKAK